MSNPEPESADRAIVRFFGLMLMAVGGMIALLCGLCSLASLAAMLSSTIALALRPGSLGSGPGLGALFIGLPFVLVMGGVPTAVGVVVFIVGRGLWRPRRKAP
jgi:hypothetical protein